METASDHGPRCVVEWGDGAALRCKLCGESTPPNTFTAEGTDGQALSTWAAKHRTTLSTRLWQLVQSSAR